MSEEIYAKLREFLDKMPGGFPQTETGIELSILKKLFTPEEAEMAVCLQALPEPVSAIAARAGMEPDKAASLLKSMARQGSIMRLRINGEPYYMANSFVVGIYEFHLKSLDAEMADFIREYEPYLSEQWGKVKTKQMRVVPVGAAIEDIPDVATYDDIRTIAMRQDNIAVADCICRVEQGLHGQQCERPLETCLVFGMGAQYYIENGLGRPISKQECMEILDRAEETALVASPGNAQDIMHVCLCCGCCCGVLRGLRRFERPADHAGSTFQARIDEGLCTGCATCADERCQIEAIVEDGEVMRVDTARCIGCGLCISTCPQEAISLVPKAEPYVPPANVVEMGLRILQDRGLA